MPARRSLPAGRFERAARLARMGAATGLGFATGRSNEKIAEQATVVLASLRGLAAKVGQMASSVEGLLPESLDAPFSKALARLRDHTETSAFDDIVSVIENELKSPLTTLFRHLEPVPIASASIGQVHRGVMHDGRVVAVKVQHPGIERAMENDLSNVRLVERFAGALIPKGFEVDRAFDEVIARFRDELDYRIEAQHQARFALLHRDSPDVVVPEVFVSHSARRVLTTELVEGRPFDVMMNEASAEQRHGYAVTLWRFVFRSILVGGEFNADPHPGNFLFRSPPAIAFLDFGCVQRLSEPRLVAARALHRSAVSRDERQFAQAVRALLDTRGGKFEAFAVEFTRKAFEPLFASPYRITPDYLRGLFVHAREAKIGLLRDRRAATPYPAELALLNRLQFGFYSLMARLDVEVDFAGIQREILASV